MEPRACLHTVLSGCCFSSWGCACSPCLVRGRLAVPGALLVARMQFLSMGSEPTGMVSLCVRAQLCPTFCNPMNYSPHQALLSMGLSI